MKKQKKHNTLNLFDFYKKGKIQEKGITLIALIITIIVLLILAGVTIAAITSNESAPNKAVEARDANKAGAEYDSIRLAAMSSVAEGELNLNVDRPTLKKALEGVVTNPETITNTEAPWIVVGAETGKYYTISLQGKAELVDGVAFTNKNVKVKPGKPFELELINITGEELTLTPATSNGITMTLGENNKVTISTASTIEVGTTASFTATAGTASDTCNVEVVYDKAGAINSQIGKNVNYSVTISGQTNPINKWQVFYADDENGEVFIISEDVLEKNTYIGGTNATSNAPAYAAGAGSSSLAEGTYGRKYNSKWFKVEGMPDAAKDTNGNPNNNAKTVAYLCDSTNANWRKYATGTFATGTEAKTANTIGNVYAVGGPTMELLYVSVKEHEPSKIVTDRTLSPTAVGYNSIFKNELPTPYKSTGGIWYVPSPMGSANGICMVDSGGNVTWSTMYNNQHPVYGIRPLISVPLDSFDVDNWIVQPITNP